VAGWNAQTARSDDPEVVERLLKEPPVAAVFCLDPEHLDGACALTETLTTDPRFERPLLVYIDGGPAEIARIKERSPFAVFVKSSELAWVLKRLIAKS